VIGNTVLFSEPQIDPGYVYITKLLEPPAASRPSTQPFPTRALRRRRGEGRRQRRHRALRWQWT
jgi:hypothetical protein